MVITMAKLRMAHASTHGARKPPGPILETGDSPGRRNKELLGAGKTSAIIIHDIL